MNFQWWHIYFSTYNRLTYHPYLQLVPSGDKSRLIGDKWLELLMLNAAVTAPNLLTPLLTALPCSTAALENQCTCWEKHEFLHEWRSANLDPVEHQYLETLIFTSHGKPTTITTPY